jgi:ABC-type transport system involved in cytochrome c biogenesis permease subunit
LLCPGQSGTIEQAADRTSSTHQFVVEGRRRVSMKWVKKLLFALVVLFAGFYLITRPEDAADAVRGVFVWVAGAVTAVFTFFTSLAT